MDTKMPQLECLLSRGLFRRFASRDVLGVDVTSTATLHDSTASGKATAV